MRIIILLLIVTSMVVIVACSTGTTEEMATETSEAAEADVASRILQPDEWRIVFESTQQETFEINEVWVQSPQSGLCAALREILTERAVVVVATHFPCRVPTVDLTSDYGWTILSTTERTTRPPGTASEAVVQSPRTRRCYRVEESGNVRLGFSLASDPTEVMCR